MRSVCLRDFTVVSLNAKKINDLLDLLRPGKYRLKQVFRKLCCNFNIGKIAFVIKISTKNVKGMIQICIYM